MEHEPSQIILKLHHLTHSKLPYLRTLTDINMPRYQQCVLPLLEKKLSPKHDLQSLGPWLLGPPQRTFGGACK